MRKFYLVTYDICNEGRLYKVYKTMRGYGDHLQYSVFRCDLSDREKVELTANLTSIIKKDEDQVLFFCLGPADSAEGEEASWIGRPYEPKNRSAIVV